MPTPITILQPIATAPSASAMKAPPLKVERRAQASIRIVVPLTAGRAEWREAPNQSKRERVLIEADGQQYLLRIVDSQ